MIDWQRFGERVPVGVECKYRDRKAFKRTIRGILLENQPFYYSDVWDREGKYPELVYLRFEAFDSGLYTGQSTHPMKPFYIMPKQTLYRVGGQWLMFNEVMK